MVVCAGWCWAGVVVGRTGVAALAVVAAIGLAGRRRWWMLAILAVAVAAGAAASAREAATLHAVVPEEARAIAGVVVSDATAAGFALAPDFIDTGAGWARWDGPRLWVRGADGPGEGGGSVEAGERVVVDGAVSPGGFRTRHGPVAAALRSVSTTVIGDPGLVMTAGAAIRHRVATVFDAPGTGPALVTGFLIGDTSRVPPADLEALRRSGLSHFVAVSGSNVALVVGGWWIIAGLFVVDGRIRAIGGLVVLLLFAIATRWEPSVIRASVMAAGVLGARMMGRRLPAWSALGGAVTVLLLISPELVESVGFQLSVAATGGVLATAGIGSGPMGTAAAATVGAQVAVAPLLLLHFGEIPLLAPVANVLAAPLVTVATAAGAVAAISGLSAIGEVAVWLANAVTLVANSFAAGPQLGLGGAIGIAAVAGAAQRRRWRPLAVAAAATTLAVSAWGPPAPDGAEVIFLDVGQGDSLLIRDSTSSVLIDGGPDPEVLRAALRRYGVRRLDLVIVSHPHADHIGGVAGIVDELPVGRLWHPPHRADDPALADLVEIARRRGIVAEAPEVGTVATVGTVHLEVLGPQRRYVSLNDGSLVVLVTAGGPRLLAAGDIEVVAQRELAPPPVDILKVPHQGAATSDLDWLADNSGSVAVISVGPNSYGHPSDKVIEVLRRSGAEVFRTDVEGDITVSLAPTTVAP